MTKDRLLAIFETALLKAGFLIVEATKDKSYPKMTDITIQIDKSIIVLHANISQISSAYLPGNSNAMRRQIAALDMETLPKNTKQSATILVGYYDDGNVGVFALWNAFYFVGHKTNRSCYVNLSDLEAAAKTGLLFSSYSKTPVYLAKDEKLKECLIKFIDDNAI